MGSWRMLINFECVWNDEAIEALSLMVGALEALGEYGPEHEIGLGEDQYVAITISHPVLLNPIVYKVAQFKW